MIDTAASSSTAAPASGPVGPAPTGPAAARTLRTLVAGGLAVVPLNQVFTDTGWIVEVWIAMAIAILPAALARLWFRSRLIQLVPGLLLVLCWLTVRYVPDHAVGGVLPLRGAWRDVAPLLSELGETVRSSVSPLHTTAPLTMVLAAGFACLAVLTDAVAVVGRRPALATTPMLLIYTVAGAVPRQAVDWLLFIPAALGFLLLLSSDAADELPRWGRVMARHPGASRPTSSLARSGRRIGLVAVCVAVLIPLVLPTRSSNLLSNAIRGGGTGDGTGDGSGGVALDPFARLQDELKRSRPVDLLTVRLTDNDSIDPYYLRAKVLDVFTGTVWRASSDRGPVAPLDRTNFDTSPSSLPGSSTHTFTADITISNLKDNPPIFASPQQISGLGSDARWESADATIGSVTVSRGDRYTETVAEPTPSAAELSSVFKAEHTELARYTEVPRTLQGDLNRAGLVVPGRDVGEGGTLASVEAIRRYLSPENGFVYSLTTGVGTSADDLVDFLKNKQGFCAQYAAAMAVLARLNGIPARVVLGYTHRAPDRGGSFTVTTNDAHAWTEVFFDGLGWVPFDPTPLGGADTARQGVLPYAPPISTPTTVGPSSTGATAGNVPGRTFQDRDLADRGGSSTGGASGSRSTGWLLLALLILLCLVALALLVPGAVRMRRRRAHLSASRRGDPDPLWAELSATALDLGYVWSAARTPRQVAGSLGKDELSSSARTALGSLATAVEQARYARPGVAASATAGALIQDLRTVESALRHGRPRRTRVRARLRPASLGWALRRRVGAPRH